VEASAVNDKRLTVDELGKVVADTDIHVEQSYSEPDDKPVDPPVCTYRMAFGEVAGVFLAGPAGDGRKYGPRDKR